MKSPGGSIFPYYYKGGEIHCLKYGSKYNNEEKLFELMKQEEEFIFNTNKKLKIWVDMYETSVTNRVLQELSNNINNLRAHIDKLSFVGLSGINIWRLRRRIKKLGITQRISFYKDPEDAKTWLVNER
ncbi:hypothetical protein MNQ98_21155 [Paenibacillus sp. N3/727]|uniref:hypothetical protein n=1 Tax=Paenibacillus sp. N3/727 TaxID=2925845 RepID=UPI001F535D50|nr:hypothetical protein [Paenibacillus sp. N3/727]UNK16980.1 hypothetical protein MNQ98_21155 [Paenibacillus sp. N3/727]